MPLLFQQFLHRFTRKVHPISDALQLLWPEHFLLENEETTWYFWCAQMFATYAQKILPSKKMDAMVL